jgi:hypothetical protein
MAEKEDEKKKRPPIGYQSLAFMLNAFGVMSVCTW